MVAHITISDKRMQKLSALILVLMLSACAEFPGVYKVAIEQGNILTQEMIGKLEVGQTKDQVQFVLGSALLRDSFSDNRWDYAYRLKHHDEFLENGNLVLLFEGNTLSSFTFEGITKVK